jgi:hypothetical protein
MNIQFNLRLLKNGILSLIAYLFLFSCAQQSAPTGGPKDIKPPKFIDASPSNLQKNVDINIEEIRINFDEYFILKNTSQNITISPPLDKKPTIIPTASPRKNIIIKFNAPLAENTTYNINFGNSIKDNNEGNGLDGFQYVFSTGDKIDSLELTGKITDVLSNDKTENVFVSLHKVTKSTTDSLILHSKPYYSSKIDSSGLFNLKYLAEGEYQIIGFKDEIPNSKYDYLKEDFGFLDSTFTLSANTTKDLKLFRPASNFRAVSAKKIGYGHLLVELEGKSLNVTVAPLNVKLGEGSKITHQTKSDSVHIWFNPTKSSFDTEKNTSILLGVTHQEKTDTLKLLYKKEEIADLIIKNKPTSNNTILNDFTLNANHLITALDAEKIAVYEDESLIPFKSTILNQKIILDFEKKWNKSYDLKLLPGAIKDLYGNSNDSISYVHKIANESDFGNLIITLKNKPKQPFLFQLLKDNEVIKSIYSSQSKFNLNYLTPGDYKLRILLDENGNGYWDTGDFLSRKQPEKVYLYSKKIIIRAFWDINETWIISTN